MQTSIALFDGAILRRAALDAVLKLNPRHLVRNPVIFVTEVVSILVTILAVRDAVAGNAFGFQANADDLTEKVLEYFADSVGIRLEVARWRRRDDPPVSGGRVGGRDAPRGFTGAAGCG